MRGFFFLCASLLVFSSTALAESTDRSTLRGINRVGVEVVGITKEAEQADLKASDIQENTESRLREGGIKVLPFRGAVDSEMACLLIRVNVVQAHDAKKPLPLYAVSGQLEVKQAVSLLRDPIHKFSGVTWLRGFNLTIGKKDLKFHFLKELQSLIDQFVEDYHRANSPSSE